ncbi:MAG: 23S rRNA (pseudouridine(1915)-N(3))-methyltransferase RlmH [Gemmatimonadota bacterium]|nr:23S rRNA (pseudouridine(1915)-N(3))-methyltransferase RlmH [Gemmatimonadota bacterium]
MASIHLLTVGRLRAAYRAAADEYLKRLSRLMPVQEREVREAGRAGNPIAQQREEGRRLAAGTPPGAITVALTREGTAWSSLELARQVQRWQEGGRPMAFLIGGATGLEPGLVRSADVRWSLGPLTLPHELARVVVLEQLYRAATILAGQPYHKGK